MTSITLNGKAVATSKNLAVINNYRRRARVEAHEIVINGRELRVIFTDGAELETLFADPMVLAFWVRRSRWAQHASRVVINGTEVSL